MRFRRLTHEIRRPRLTVVVASLLPGAIATDEVVAGAELVLLVVGGVVPVPAMQYLCVSISDRAPRNALDIRRHW